VLLYDSGPSWGPHSDAGARVVLPYLRGEGITRLDALVISHEDSDHSGGARSVLEGMRTDRLVSSLPPEHALQGMAPYRLPCQAGQSWRWDGVRFTMLHPSEASYANPFATLNERSCVLRIDSARGSVLLTGDIGARSEAELLALGGLEADVVLVPHHGSGQSSSARFVDAVSASHALVSAGRGNRFGHPRPEVVERYLRTGRVLSTDTDGAITLRAGTPWTASTHRSAARRYWR
jgi:competence protein ComEC